MLDLAIAPRHLYIDVVVSMRDPQHGWFLVGKVQLKWMIWGILGLPLFQETTMWYTIRMYRINRTRSVKSHKG